MHSGTRTRVKICGITRIEDALTAVDQGADAIGLVFYARSPRGIDMLTAKRIIDALPPFVTPVGLFVNAGREAVNKVLDQLPLGLLQFHGDETPSECEGFGLPWVKAIRMRPQIDVQTTAQDFAGAAALLLDAYTPGQFGGTGERFAWERIPSDLGRPLVLAGGLTPNNVAGAIQAVRPYAVDVSGGVESAKGIKDPARVAAFLQATRRADRAIIED